MDFLGDTEREWYEMRGDVHFEGRFGILLDLDSGKISLSMMEIMLD